MLHPSHLALLEMCHSSHGSGVTGGGAVSSGADSASANGCLGDILMIDFSKLRTYGPLDQHQLKNNIAIDLEKNQDFIRGIWYTNFINIFADQTKYRPISNSLLPSFYRSVTVLASNLVYLRNLTSSL